MVYLPEDCQPLATTIRKNQIPGYICVAMRTAKSKHVSVFSIRRVHLALG